VNYVCEFPKKQGDPMKYYILAIIIALTLNSSFALADNSTATKNEAETPAVSDSAPAQSLTQQEIMQSMMKSMEEMSAAISVIADKMESMHEKDDDQPEQKMQKYKMQMKEHLDKARKTDDPAEKEQQMEKHMQKMQEMMADMKKSRTDKPDSENRGKSFCRIKDSNDKKKKEESGGRKKGAHRKEVDQRLDNIEVLLDELLRHQAVEME